MTPESQPDQVEVLMARYLDTPAAERAARLRELCAEHPGLEPELRRRLAFLENMGVEAPRPSEDLPRDLGDFRLLERIGAGGMGVVFRAEQLSLGRSVAVKVVRPEQLFFDGARERFRREVEAVARLDHVGIVPVYTVGEEEGVPFFAMALLQGCTLADLLEDLADRDPQSLTGRDMAAVVAERSGLAEREVDAELFASSWCEACLNIAAQIARALEHAHGRGILHRDVKPSNIALTPDGRAMLLDFGLTSTGGESERITRSGSQIGTLYYMSPEQLRGGELDARTDVYSLGVALYELLTLQVPYVGENRVQTEAAIEGGSYPPIRARNRRVPVDAETVCTVAMELEPADRYTDAGAFAEDLENVVALRPIRARPPGTPKRAVRWARRHPSRAAVGVLSLLLVTGVPSALYLQQRAYTAELRQALDEREAALVAKDEAIVARDDALVRKDTALEQERRATDDANAAFRFLVQLFYSASPTETRGREVTVLEVLDRGAAEVARLDGRPRLQALVLRAIGEVYRELARFDEAIALLERAVAIEREAFGSVEEHTAMSIDFLAGALQRAGDLERAESLFREGLAAQLALRGADHLATAAAMNNLAALLYDRGQFDESEGFMRDALRIYADSDAAEPGSWEHIYSNLALLLRSQGRTEEAEATAAEALERLRGHVTPPHPSLVTALTTAGMLLKDRGELEEAEEHYQQAIAMQRELVEGPHDRLAASLYNLGRLIEARGELERAEQLIIEAIEMLETLVSDDHPNLVNSRSQLADLQRRIRGG